MQTRHPVFEDLARIVTGAAGAVQAAGEEARTFVRSQGDRFVADMDLARREEVEALREIAASALARVEVLERELAEIKASLRNPGAIAPDR